MKSVFITGGTGGIGSVLVKNFAECGYDVHFQYNNNVQKADELTNQYGAISYYMDFTTDIIIPDIEVDILINNAGVNLSGHDALETSDSELKSTFDVNVLAVLGLCKAFLPKMREKKWGRIININSLYGVKAEAKRLSYNVSKHGLRALTVTLAKENAPFGVTVNDICPGPVETEMLMQMGELALREGRANSLEGYLENLGNDMPIKSLISADEIAHATMFLSDDNAGCFTGLALMADGGLSL